MTTELQTLCKEIAIEFKLLPASLGAFIEIESGGSGFAKDTGKILIQFEPHWFKRKVPYAPSGAWSVNKVDVQSKEWIAFNNAFSINPTGAMESTSIVLGQIMGFHFKRLGFKSVDEFWDFNKKSLRNQVWCIAKFIATDSNLLTAIKVLNWHKVAVLYNGAGYKELAKKYGREPYNISLAKAFGIVNYPLP